MALNPRQKFPAVDILQQDYEYMALSRYIESSRDVLGTPARALTQQSTNNKVGIQQLVGSPTFPNQAGLSDTQKQGIVLQSTHIMFTATALDVLARDVITDVDGAVFDVIHVTNWYSHKEVLLAKRN